MYGPTDAACDGHEDQRRQEGEKRSLFSVLQQGLVLALNLNQSYPIAFVVCSMIAETLIVCGVFLFGLGVSPDYARIWRWLFPLLAFEQAAGIIVDAAILPDAPSVYWMAGVFFGLWIAAPAYYFNFQVARYRR